MTLWTILAVIFFIWLLGVFFEFLGKLIHVLLVVVVILIVLRLLGLA